MRILVFFAHPDDETMLAGGTLAFLAKLGAEVHYFSATRGEGGDLGEPALCTRAQVGELREEELVCAVRALGGSSLHFMDYIDPTVGAENELYAFEGDDVVFAEKIMDEIRAMQADVVISHGSDGEYGHPAHLKVHLGVKQALLNLPEAECPLFYTFQGAFSGHPKERVMNVTDPAHVILDIASVTAEKLAAIACHKTQHALFLRHVEPDEQGQRLLKLAVMPLESLHRVFPAVESLPVQDALTDLLAGVEGVTLLAELSIPAKS